MTTQVAGSTTTVVDRVRPTVEPALARADAAENAGGWREDLAVLGLLLVLCFLAYPRVFLYGEVISPAGQLFSYAPWLYADPSGTTLPCNNVLSDEIDSTIPITGYVRDCLLSGDIPAWCEKTQNGTPMFWVIMHDLMLLPLQALVLPLGVAWGLTVFALLRQVVGGLFFFKYCRIMGIGRWAGLCAAVVFSYGSFPVQTFGRPLSFQYALLPLTAYALERIIRDRSLLWAAILPFVLQMNILSGFPAGTFYCFYFLLLYGLVRISREPGRRLRLFGWLSVLGGVAVLLTALPMVATADYFGRFDWAYRGGNWLSRLPGVSLLTCFFPFLCGPPTLSLPVLNASDIRYFWFEKGLYIGVLPILTVLLSLLHLRRDRVRWFYILFGVWLLVVMFDVGGILENVLRHVPVFRSSINTRQKGVLVFILAMLFAWGLDDLALNHVGLRARRLGTILLLPLLGMVIWGIVAYHRGTGLTPFQQAHFWLQGIIVGASVLLLAIFRRRRIHPWMLKASVLLLVFLDLQAMDKTALGLQNRPDATMWRKISSCFTPSTMCAWNPTIPPEQFYPVTPGIRYLQQNIGEHKMLTLERTFLSNTPLYFGLNNLSGRAFTTAREKETYRIIADDAFREKATQFLFSNSMRTRLDRRFVDALGIKYVLLGSGRTVDDLARDYLLYQPEWNSSVLLEPGGRVRQTATVERTMEVNRLSVRCAEFGLPDASQLRLRIKDLTEHTSQEWPEGEWQATSGTVVFVLDGCRLQEGHNYSIEIGLDRQATGSARLRCTKDVYILGNGKLFVDEKEYPGELAFSVCMDLARQYLVNQPEWNDSVSLAGGDRVIQTFTAARPLQADQCDIRVKENLLADPNGLTLAITDLTANSVGKQVSGSWHPEMGAVSFALDGFSFAPKHRYAAEVAVDPQNAGTLVLLCTKDVDLIPQGTLATGGQTRTGDLTFSVYSRESHDLGRFRLVYDRDLTILENTAVFERTWLVGGIRCAGDEETLNGLKSDSLDLRTCAWAAADNREASGEPLPPREVQGQATATCLRSSYQRFEVKVDQACYLINSDNYDRNWRARIDGREVPIFRANCNMRGVRVPGGQHVVEFRYAPPYFVAALIITLVSCFGFLGFMARKAIRRSRSSGRPLGVVTPPPGNIPAPSATTAEE